MLFGQYGVKFSLNILVIFLAHFLAHLVERWTQKVLQSAIASSSRSYRQLI